MSIDTRSLFEQSFIANCAAILGARVALKHGGLSNDDFVTASCTANAVVRCLIEEEKEANRA